MNNEATSQPSDNENRSSTPPPQPVTATKGKSRNPIERMIVWGIIILIVAYGGFELRSKYGFDKSLAALKDAAEVSRNASKELEGDKDELLRSNLSDYLFYSPSETESKDGFRTVLTYKWPSLWREYSISIILDSDKDHASVFEISWSGKEPAEDAEE